MKSAVFLLGALASAKCPLNMRKCKSLTMGESLKTRVVQGIRLLANDVTNDLLLRAGDQVAWGIKCPRGSPKPFAVATSNGLWVRFMAKRNAPWQVSTLPVDEFGKLGCQNFTQLKLFDANTVLPSIKDSQKSCGKGCVAIPAKLLLYPDVTFLQTLPKKEEKNFFELSLSVSSMNKQQRKRLAKNKAVVVVFKCKGQPLIAWGDLNKNKLGQVLILDTQQGATENALVKLVEMNLFWLLERCN